MKVAERQIGDNMISIVGVDQEHRIQSRFGPLL